MQKKIAILGYSFRFPGTNRHDYWKHLLDGRDLVTEVESERWAMETFRHPDKSHPGTSYTFAAGSIGDVSKFDADFFGISPREAALMDPQQRLLLEMGWEALENAGIKPSSMRGSACGVYIGIASNDYAYRLADDLNAVDASTATGVTSSIAANRLSYVLDLHGPSMALDTACSSSLVAFHQACQSIAAGESTMALVGGVSLHLHPYGFITFSKASMLSRRGRCQVFDAVGDGYVRSEGGGVFLLKDYDQALMDGDTILATVAASGVNTDGRKSGLTVPNADAQAELLIRTYAHAGIDPEAIDYLEAHGTGTTVGDPLEAMAIGRALGRRRPRSNPLPIGSIKSNLGHMEAASGIAGLVKALHCIRQREVPATIGIRTLNPNIDFDALNIDVVTKNRPLKAHGKLIVGVNSFGFGGANAHVVLESHEPSVAISRTSRPKKIPATPAVAILPLLVSARNPNGLKQLASELSQFLSENPGMPVYDLAYTCIFHREAHSHRAVLWGADSSELITALNAFSADDSMDGAASVSGTALAVASDTAFIYSGNGSQWAGMGRNLLKTSAVFLSSIREIDGYFQQHADYSLEAELSGLLATPNRYELTEIAQPALFAIQVGVTRMLAERGITPAAVAGHSVGEVAAAWASGALSLEDAVAVVYHRSHAQGLTKGSGRMTAVGCGLSQIEAVIHPLGLSNLLTVAGVNSSRGITLAGGARDLEKLEHQLALDNVLFKRLDMDYAFHSPAMDSIEDVILQSLADISPRAAEIPFYSTVTGTRLKGTELVADYWWRNIRKPVLFEAACKQILKSGATVFIEVGPHAVMRGYLNDCLKDQNVDGRVIATLQRGDDAESRVLAAVGQTVIAGAVIDWNAIFPMKGRFVPLPNYPWQRERHWHPVSQDTMGLLYRHKIHPLLGYALRQHELTWENRLDTGYLPSLADHVVGDATVFPGTGFAELALAAALAWKPNDHAEIEALEIRSPLILSSDIARTVRTAIVAQDGALRIVSREQPDSEAWVVHAVGRVLGEPGTLLRQAPVWHLPNRDPDFDAARHETLTRAAGLSYGPVFRRIAYGWREAATVKALFTPGGLQAGTNACISPDLAGTYLHPAILDCAFQLIIHLMADEASVKGVAFVPVYMGRIVFHRHDLVPHSACATLLQRAPHSLTAEFALYDEGGHAIAVVKEARFRSVRLRTDAVDHLRFLDYGLTPAPHPLAPAQGSAMCRVTVCDELATTMLQCAEHPDNQRYAAEVEPLLDSLCSQFALEALRQLAEKTGGAAGEIGAACFGADKPIAGYLLTWLQQAEQDRWLTRTATGWILTDQAPCDIAAADIWSSLITDYPEYFNLIQAVGRLGMRLPAMLTAADGWEDIAAPPAFAALWRTGFGAANLRTLQAAFNRLLLDGLRDLPDGERLGVLEIGEGKAIWIAGLCAQLDFNRADAGFASFSASALEQAGLLQEEYPRLVVRQIDAAEQTFGRDTPENVLSAISLVIVNLDFNTVDDAVQALRYAYAQLLAGGTVVLAGQHPARWMDFVTQGDSKHAAGHTLQFWQEQLQTLGFADAVSAQISPDTFTGTYMLAAQKPAQPSPVRVPVAAASSRNWLILADATEYSTRLAQALAAGFSLREEKYRIELAGDAPHLTSLLQPDGTQLDGIIYLSGFKPLLANAPSANSNSVVSVEQQVQRCAQLAALVQACEAAGTQTTCWLLTAGVVLGMLPRQSASTTVIADAALWGYGRTVMNEASHYAVRMVDFAAPEDIELVAACLQRELVQTDDETEVLYAADGARYAPRLRVESRPASPNAHADDANLRLGFHTPGQLRYLHWDKYPRVVPKDDEIEVEVQATGLNFRDVMYALGMLSDEAVENGFAGPSLGLEFAGAVSRVGKNVISYKTGDRVMGFGPSSFGNRVVTHDSAIARIPGELSYEAAATIPSVFLTGYYALHHLARLQPGERILIHGAAGGVGIAAIQIAQHLGAEIYATAGSDDKRDFLRLLGVRHIYDSRSLTYAGEIMADTAGSGVDVVLNSLAGEAVRRNFQVLKPFGRFLELGKRDFYENTHIGLRPFRNNISYFGIDADQLMQVRPELTRRLFADVIGLFETGILHPLPYTVFEANHIVDAFRHMQQARQIGKIVVTYHQAIRHAHTISRNDAPVLQLNAEATYLVTGGLSGFGLKTAEWLAGKGARHLVLISRSGPQSVEAKEALARLNQLGVTCHAAACDVTDRAALSTLLQKVAATMPPLKGIVHAAMVIADGLVRNTDVEQIRRVLLPKVLGAYHLHELTAGCALDYFILFSSATTLFGNPGQGNYVAANAALEALARSRRTAGLAATCVRWGAIDDVGFLARNQTIKDALQSRMGGGALHSAVALDALESMLLADRSGLGVMELDWKALARFLPTADAAKFREMAQQHYGAEDETEHDDDIERMLIELSGTALQTAVEEMIRQEVGEILRIGPDKIDPKRSIYDMGLDSLMGVELVLALESRFGIRLSVMALSESPTIARLAERMIELLTSRTVPEESDDIALQVTQIAAQHGTVMTTESAAEMILSVQDNVRSSNNKRMIPRTAADPHVL